MGKVKLYNIDWKDSLVSDFEVDITKKKEDEHLEDFLNDWFITNFKEIPLSYEIRD